MENWYFGRRYYFLNNDHDEFRGTHEDGIGRRTQEQLRSTLHRPIGFVLPGYRRRLYQNIALGSIDYA